MDRRWIAVVYASAALSLAGPARAQNASEQAEARTLFNEGARLFAAGNYPEACSKLEASYHLYAGIGTRGKLAECYEKVGRTASAWAMYEEVAALAGKAGDAARERVAKERAAALLPKLSHLTIVLPPASDLPGLVVKRGDEAIEKGAFGAPVAVDPGTQSFEVSAPGHTTKTADLDIPDGQAATFTVPALEPVADIPPPPGGATSLATPSPSRPESAHGPTWLPPTGIAVAGVGVAGVVVGSIVALSAKSSYGSAFDSGACQKATLTCTQDGQNKTDSARSNANLGGIILGVGAALVVGGGVLFFEAVHLAKTQAALQVTPSIAPHAAGLDLAASF
jgi:hypothetical protein